MSTTTQLGKVSVTPQGAWSSTTAYAALDIVSHSGSSYLAKQAVPAGTALSNTTYWMPIAEKGSTSNTAVIADVYSASSTYAIGDYVLYNDLLYRCITAITTAEAWTAAHWTEVSVGDEFKADKVLIDGRIKKFFTTNRNNSDTAYTNTVSDSDDGAIRNLKIYGMGSQGENPSPSNPQTIHSTVNPTMNVSSHMVFKYKLEQKTISGVTFTPVYNGDTLQYINVNGHSDAAYITYSLTNKRVLMSELIWDTTKTYYLGTIDSDTDTGLSILLDGGISNYAESSTKTGATFSGSLNDTVRVSLRIEESGKTITNIKVYPTLNEVGDTEYNPIKFQSATLAKTLNAIPVSSGGNITINGQQYISDYVDVENKKIVRMVGTQDLGALTFRYDPTTLIFYAQGSDLPSSFKMYGKSLCSIYVCGNTVYSSMVNNELSMNRVSWTGLIVPVVLIKNASYTDASSFIAAMSGVILYYERSTAVEESLTDAEVADFLAMRSYYPQTNIAVTSTDLDGQATLLYPCSMENFVEYVKGELGDERETVYDMQDISDQAFITAQYAEICAEMALDD